MRNKKIITLFFVVFLLFLLGSVSAFALGDDYTEDGLITDIMRYKRNLWGDIYNQSDWIGYDLICSSGINSNVVGKDAEAAAAKCDVAIYSLNLQLRCLSPLLRFICDNK